MSLSNRCNPPLGNPSTLKVGTFGVGVGSATLLGFRPPKEKDALRGVATEPSEPSGLDMDKFRCFRLKDDLFFLIPVAEVLPVFGEPGTRVESFDMAWLRADVAGETLNVGSAGLGTGGCERGALRPNCE
jgi:hypothetical protein